MVNFEREARNYITNEDTTTLTNDRGCRNGESDHFSRWRLLAFFKRGNLFFFSERIAGNCSVFDQDPVLFSVDRVKNSECFAVVIGPRSMETSLRRRVAPRDG